MSNETHDNEIELYRSLLDTPDEFKDAFTWTTVAGNLLLRPRDAAGIDLSRTHDGRQPRARRVVGHRDSLHGDRPPRPQAAVETAPRHPPPRGERDDGRQYSLPGGPMGHLVYRAYLATSEVARDAGMSGAFPSWFCPPPDSPALAARTLFHQDWLVPIAIIAFMMPSDWSNDTRWATSSSASPPTWRTSRSRWRLLPRKARWHWRRPTPSPADEAEPRIPGQGHPKGQPMGAIFLAGAPCWAWPSASSR